jgi:hypothetical protein
MSASATVHGSGGRPELSRCGFILRPAEAGSPAEHDLVVQEIVDPLYKLIALCQAAPPPSHIIKLPLAGRVRGHIGPMLRFCRMRKTFDTVLDQLLNHEATHVRFLRFGGNLNCCSRNFV